MKVELLVVADCPNEALAAAVLRQALDDAGMSLVSFTRRVVTSQQEADQLGFLGSPSILIDGHDPFAAPEQNPALACRLYRDNSGVTGVPPLERLRQALESVPDEGRRPL